MNVELENMARLFPEELTAIKEHISNLPSANSSAFSRRKFDKLLLGFVASLVLPTLKPIPPADAFVLAFLRIIALSALSVAIEEGMRQWWQNRANRGNAYAAPQDQNTLMPLWARSGYKNRLLLHYRNMTGHRLHPTCQVYLQDVSTSKIEKCRYLRHSNPIEPGESLRAIVLDTLPTTGIKRVFVETEDKRIVCEPSCEINVVEGWELRMMSNSS